MSGARELIKNSMQESIVAKVELTAALVVFGAVDFFSDTFCTVHFGLELYCVLFWQVANFLFKGHDYVVVVRIRKPTLTFGAVSFLGFAFVFTTFFGLAGAFFAATLSL